MTESLSTRHFPKIAAHSQVPAWLVEHTERNRHELGPHRSVVEEWTRAGLVRPDMAAIRRYRLERVQEQLRTHNIDGFVLH
ncbi:MAG: hypothetical protein F4125_02570, partial [Acidimicrobiaceae bacterium]|nr:hypothetical protein [Acidimicrobiaceae bacterium]